MIMILHLPTILVFTGVEAFSSILIPLCAGHAAKDSLQSAADACFRYVREVRDMDTLKYMCIYA